MADTFLNLKDTDGDGKISQSEFQRARDPKSGAMAISPHIGEKGLSLICSDPELKNKLNKIEKDRFDLANSNKPLTGRDLIDSQNMTADLYKDLAEKIASGELSPIGREKFSAEEKKQLHTEYMQKHHAIKQDVYDTEVGMPRTDSNQLASVLQNQIRSELRAFPGGVEYAPIQDCLVGQGPDSMQPSMLATTSPKNNGMKLG